MIKTAVVGATGYIGRHLWQSYRTKFSDCVGTYYSSPKSGLSFLDIRQPDLKRLKLRESNHKAVLIASAKPNIAYCQNNTQAAYDVNVTGTLELVRQARDEGLKVVFLSSDYVFDGLSGGYDDRAVPRPTTEYGRQKLLVEQEIPSLTNDYLILRLSKIFGIEKGDGTLLDEMASSLVARREVLAAYDQVFSPTYVGDLVCAIQSVQERGHIGTMNVCSPEIWSRYEIADSVRRAIGLDESLVKRVALYDLPGMAGRPLNTSMKCSRLSGDGKVAFTPLAAHIAHVAAIWKRHM